MLGFVRTDNEALVSCLGDPQRAVTAYHELLRRGKDAVGAIRSGLRDENRPSARAAAASWTTWSTPTPCGTWPLTRTRTSARGRLS
jgi:hypothetical protein